MKLFKKMKEVQGEENLINTNESRLLNKVKTLREVVVCQNVNPLPDDRIEIINGRKIFARTLYVSAMPRRSTFAHTFQETIKFGKSNVSIFVKPLRDGRAIKDLEEAVFNLETKLSLEKDDRNKIRKLNKKMTEAESFVDSIDGGENAAYEVAILITIYADSIEELNKLTDKLRNKARETSVILSMPYPDQERTFISNLPVNYNRVGYWHLMDKYSVSTLFHYTNGKFGHPTGAIIGRNIETHELVAHDPFMKGLKGYNVVISGTTRAGKSTLVKSWIKRYYKPLFDEIKDGVKYYAMDTEGEYGPVFESIGGINIVIGNNTDTILNPFELDIEYERDKITSVERPRLDLTSKINGVTYDIMMMARGADPKSSKLTDIGSTIVKDIIKLEYEELKIKEGNPDSLYVEKHGMSVKKELPTLSSWYQRLVQNEKNYLNPTYKVEYDILTMVMKDWVRCMGGTRVYFDGQSKVPLNKPVSGFCFDLHHLDEKNERPIAQAIAMTIMLEGEVKKNSEDPLKAKKIMMIFDEAHFLLPYPEARQKLTDAYRRAAKKNVGILSASQNINDWMRYEETHPIFTNASTKILLRHDPSEKEALMKLMQITDAEADRIISSEQGQFYIICGNEKAYVQLELMPSELELFDTDMNSRRTREEEKLKKAVL